MASNYEEKITAELRDWVSFLDEDDISPMN
jgi:hypothetical protein